MNKIWIGMVCATLMAVNAFGARNFFKFGSGDWNTPSKWEKGQVLGTDAGNYGFVQSGYVCDITSATAGTNPFNFYIRGGATLNIGADYKSFGTNGLQCPK